jgi:murein DD-endopeptidase MepM/ murein hydrolase activator NlpD
MAFFLASGACSSVHFQSAPGAHSDRLGGWDSGGSRSEEGVSSESEGLRSDSLLGEESQPPLSLAALECVGQLRWPLKTVFVTSHFGRRGRRAHEGVDLRAHSGTPVYAAHDGVVQVSRRVRGYGNLVLIRHPHGLSTVYGHNSRLIVKSGQKVKQGQLIARSGNTGRSRGPHLHFEVRYQAQGEALVLDPHRWIPSSSIAIARVSEPASQRRVRRSKSSRSVQTASRQVPVLSTDS